MTVPTALARPIIRLNLRNVWRWFAFGTLIGVVAGVGAIVFNLLSQLSINFFLGTMVGWQPDEAAGEYSAINPRQPDPAGCGRA